MQFIMKTRYQEELKFGVMEHGGLCAAPTGIYVMQQWLVVNGLPVSTICSTFSCLWSSQWTNMAG